jgi:uncharacterized membrane protein YdjX (TVP38/TMEM64 family)
LKTNPKINLVVRDVWLFVIFTALYLYFFQRGFIDGQIARIADAPLSVRYWIYFVLGSLRGFTLIPVTYLIILGLLFLPLKPLFLLTIAGVMVSSAIIYYFAELIHLSAYFERKYPVQINKLKSVMEKNELPIVILWSMLPFTPTDVVCYVCGSLNVGIKKFLLGVLIGEGITCALYIFFGKEIMQFLLRLI